MSSFWASMRSKKSTKEGETDDIGKPPSGRSSKRSHTSSTAEDKKDKSEDQNVAPNPGVVEDSTISEDDQKSLKRTSRISRFKEQILGKRSKSRDPSEKSQRSCSPQTPRSKRFHSPFAYFRSLKSDKTEEKEPSIPDSPKPVVKRFKKRAASASPSRCEGEQKKLFKGLSRDHLISPLPEPLKKFLLNRRSKSETREITPIKPARRPGPLGRSWVKVYSDIAYMDDQTSSDIYPIPAYTGKPTNVPEAIPLPKAPTPPPPAKQPEKSAEETTRDEELQAPTKDTESSEVQVTTTECSVVEKQGEIKESGEAPKETSRPSRSRDNSRFKNKKNKRPPTPLVSDDDSKAEKSSLKEMFSIPAEKVDTEEPHSDATKPELVIKPVERIKNTKHVIYICDPNNEESKVEDTSLVDQLGLDSLLPIKTPSKKMKTLVARPQDCKEGEPITLETTKVVTTVIIKNKMTATEKDVSLQNLPQKILIETVPAKPKRKPRLYENVEEFLESQNVSKREVLETVVTVEKSQAVKEIEIAKSVEVENADIPTENENTESALMVEPIETSCSLEAGEEIKEEANKVSVPNDPEVPPLAEHNKESPEYAVVHKTSLTSSLKEELRNSNNENIPPPIPPKKKPCQDSHLRQEIHQPPPRPPRHLKPRTRSLEPSPSRKKKRVLSLLNENEPSRPNRGTKIYSGFVMKGSTPQNQTPQITRRHINHRDRPLPAPPRKKKSQETAKPAPKDEPVEAQIPPEMSPPAVNLDETSPPLVEKRKKRGRVSNPLHLMHDTHNDQPAQSEISPITDSPVLYPSTTNEPYQTKSELDTEIDANLQNIEASFTTLETVLSSLKKYSCDFPLNFLGDGRRRSCDVFYSSSLRSSKEGGLQNIEMSHSLDGDSSQFSDLQLNDILMRYPPTTGFTSSEQSENTSPNGSSSSQISTNTVEATSVDELEHSSKSSGLSNEYEPSPLESHVPSNPLSTDDKLSDSIPSSCMDQYLIAEDSFASDESQEPLSDKLNYPDYFSDGPPTPSSSPVDFELTEEPYHKQSPYTLPEEVASTQIPPDEDIIIATPIRSKVVLGIVPKSGEQITTETHRLKTGYSTDSKPSVDESSENINTVSDTNVDINTEEEDFDEDTIVETGMDTVTFLESEEEEMADQPNVFVLGPIIPSHVSDVNQKQIIPEPPLNAEDFREAKTESIDNIVTTGKVENNKSMDISLQSEHPVQMNLQERKETLEDTAVSQQSETMTANEEKELRPDIPSSDKEIGTDITDHSQPSQESFDKTLTGHETTERDLKDLLAGKSLETAESNPSSSILEVQDDIIPEPKTSGKDINPNTESFPVQENSDQTNLYERKEKDLSLISGVQSDPQILLEKNIQIEQLCDKIVNKILEDASNDIESLIEKETYKINYNALKEPAGTQVEGYEPKKNQLDCDRPSIASNDEVQSPNSNLTQAEFLQKLLQDMSVELDEPNENSETSSVSQDTEQLVSQEDLLEGVAAITDQLEGIAYQIKDVMRGYNPSSSDDSPLSSEYASTNTSNRSSVDIDALDNESSTTYYSMSQPSMSNYSLLSYHTAQSPASPSPDLSDSRGSTPTLQESTVEQDEDEDTIAPEKTMEHSDSQSSE